MSKEETKEEQQKEHNRRSRSWCFTLNNYTDEEVERLQSEALKTQYLVFGREVGDKGTPHLQGYVYFEHKKSFKQLKAFIGKRAHIEITRGSFLANIRYCSKEDPEPFTHGTPPATAQEKGRLTKERYAKLWKDAVSGDLSQIDPQRKIQHYRTLKQIGQDALDMSGTLEETTGHWITGSFGCGKSHLARTTYPNAYIKTPDQWWDNYNGQETVIIEDMDPYHVALGYSLKIWGDKYSFPAPYKGGIYKAIRPQRIIITSQYLPSDIWTDKKTIDAIEDRYTLTCLPGKSRRVKKNVRFNPFRKFHDKKTEKIMKEKNSVDFSRDIEFHRKQFQHERQPVPQVSASCNQDGQVCAPVHENVQTAQSIPKPPLVRQGAYCPPEVQKEDRESLSQHEDD